MGDDGAATMVTYRMDFTLPPGLSRLASSFLNLDALIEGAGRRLPAQRARNT